jgi:hypothetical protein
MNGPPVSGSFLSSARQQELDDRCSSLVFVEHLAVGGDKEFSVPPLNPSSLETQTAEHELAQRLFL